MKSNKDILAARFEPNGFSIQKALGLPDDHSLIADPAYKRILFAMQLAQVEAINELVKRKWDDTNNMFMGGTGTKCKSLDDIALELIKEIES